MNGLFLRPGENVEAVHPETGLTQMDLLEDERRYEATEIESKVTSPDSNRKILAEIKKYADAHEQLTGRFPKTLIFAANDLPNVGHANQLVDLAVKDEVEIVRLRLGQLGRGGAQLGAQAHTLTFVTVTRQPGKPVEETRFQRVTQPARMFSAFREV